MKRNLLYNACPIIGAESITRDNIAQLCHRAELFNGRKIVNIKTGDNLEKSEDIKPLFSALGDVEFIEYPNDPVLGEYVGFLEGWESLASFDKREITFYSHTKGVGPRNRAPIATANHERFIRHWYTKMYRHCLCEAEWIDNAMREHSAAGCYRMLRYEGDGRWIFAGANYWVNHYRLFTKPNWADLPASKWVPEALFLANVFDWRDTVDLYTRYTLSCKKCGRYNWTPEKPIDPRFTKCPKCGRPLLSVPIIPGDMDDEPPDRNRGNRAEMGRVVQPFRRNLIYNCCPLKGAEHIVRDNIDRLTRHANVFTGRKIVNIKTGPELEASEDIKPLFAALGDIEFCISQNDVATGEYNGFRAGLERLRSTDAREITLYAHTKGVAPYNRIPENRLESIRQWYRRMYHECLSDPERIDRIMGEYAACGAFYKLRPISHFSGAFFWFNHARLYSKPNWNKDPQPNGALDQFCRTIGNMETERKRFFVEMYLGTLFEPREFYDLHSVPDNHNLYVMGYRGYRCRKCGLFTALNRGAVKCPKCGDRSPTMLGWPELGV